MSKDILRGQRLTWARKPVLRILYEDYYRRILGHCRSGLTLEIGGGSGNLKSYLDDVLSTDIVHATWLDATADAQALPFGAGVFTNIVGVDVLHHVERPHRFLTEAVRVLAPGGRVIMVEPAITPVSSVFYRLAHPEPVHMDADPLEDGPLDPERKPFDANQAIPTLLLWKQRQRFTELFPELRIVEASRLSMLAYPLSGGFRSWSLLPASWTPFVLGVEDRLAPLLSWLLAFRLIMVLEKER